jgi:hypothetical protein
VLERASGIGVPMALQQHLFRSYDPRDEVDLGGFVGSLAAYAASVAGLVGASRALGKTLPERYEVADLVIGGVATHKLTRLLSSASVTSPLRAPFTEFEEAAGSGEHHESPRGEHGVRHTVGELLTCPFCLAVWVASAYIGGLVTAPRATRAAAAVLSVVAASDALQHVYARLRTD